MGLLDMVKTSAQGLGSALLGKGTGSTDATPQARAYALYAAEKRALGEVPLTYAEWLRNP
jgi:hypothetical protein